MHNLCGAAADPDQVALAAEFKDVITFNIDFDAQKDLVRKFGATMQSTLIVYKGDRELARSTGETRSEAIASLLNGAV